jgi:spermidine synthase
MHTTNGNNASLAQARGPMLCAYLGLALLSAAALAFEITLTRLFSVTEWYHFAFLAVSVALLGYGASGTALSLVPRWGRPPTARRTSALAALFAAGMILATLSLNHLPFDSYRIAWERVQVLYLVLYYLSLTVPFFCAGLVTGLLLTAYAEHSARIYAANLLGSAAGGLLPLLLLPLLGEGAILSIAALGLLAALVFQLSICSRQTSDLRQRALAPRPQSLALLLGIVLLLVLAILLPAPFQLRLSPYKGLSQVMRFPDSEIVWERWNAFSRVDRVASSAIRSAPGLSLSYPGELPAQDGLFVDGDDLSPVVRASATGAATDHLGEFTSYLPVALPYQLRPGARALVLGPRGGLDIWVALHQGAAEVVAVEPNPLVIAASELAYGQASVEVVVEEGRSYVRQSAVGATRPPGQALPRPSPSPPRFDVIHLALIDSYRPVTSGAYSLGERYDLTVEAFEDYLQHLEPGGLLVVERWLQVPPSETLRAGAAVVQALRRSGVEHPAARLAVLRGWQVGLILAKQGDWTSGELEAIREFAQAQDLDLVALPGLSESEANQRNVLEEPVFYRAFQQLLAEPDALYATHPYDVRPATDDRPFFFHFFRWGQAGAVLAQLGRTWQPWGGSGYFVLFALLAVAVVTSVGLILLPLVVGKRMRADRQVPPGTTGRVLVYFGLLGLGFLFVEIPLIQRFILFLGQPVYAFAAVVAAVLFFSGLGSLAAPRLPLRWMLLLLVMAIALYPLGLPVLFRTFLGAPLGVRLLVTGLSLAPLGILLGMPFPGGLAWLRRRAPAMIPWAWAVNGCASVLASILAAILALSAGFSWVLGAAALAYTTAWLTLYLPISSFPGTIQS